MSIRKLIAILIILMATAPLGIFIYTAANQRTQDINQAAALSAAVATKILTEQNTLTSGAEQLAMTLSHVPAVSNQNSAAASLLLKKLLASSPQFATIFLLDLQGTCWASALPEQISISYADRRYFKNVIATGKFSSGEFTIGKALNLPVFSFAYPIKDVSGNITGAAVIVIKLDRYQKLFEQNAFTFDASSIMLVDHRGTILFSSFNPALAGKHDKIFHLMTTGPDEGFFEASGNNSFDRLFTYKKVYLKDETTPYLYIRTGISKEIIFRSINRNFFINVGILSLVMLFILGIAVFLTKRYIHDKIITLRDATHAIAGDDLSVRVAQRVSGGELGELGCAFDEMAQKLSESIQERKRTEEELRHSQNLLSGIVENAPYALFVKEVADDFRVILWNRAAEQIFAIPAATIVNKNVHDLWPREQAEAFLAEDIQIVSQRSMVDVPEQISDHPQKGQIYIHSRKIPLFGQNGEVSHIVVISDDITEHRLIQAEFIKHQKLESLGVLAGGIAHDFNNLLTGIMGNISFARMYLEPSHKAAAILVEAEKASQRASDLAYQLLTFAKGGQPIKKAVDVRNSIETSVSLVLRGSKVKSIVEISDTLGAIEADEGQIHQVFNNIIINAVQSMPDGGTLNIRADQVRQVDASLPGELPRDFIRITFSDTGCGISEEDQKRIFDPYFTTKDGGNGLGLASAYSIITKHGGRISVHSAPGAGATFEILLPSTLWKAVAFQGDDTTTATAAEYSGRKILVMDDDLMIRDLSSNMLGELGYDVITCDTGEEAVELYRQADKAGEPFAAVIMDLTIPGAMGGKEAAELILKQFPQARLVVSSGYSNDPVMANHLCYGFCAAMIKPYTISGVARLLNAVFSEVPPAA